MTVSDRLARRYCRRVRGWLPCSGRMKRRMMKEIRGRVRDLLEREPDADMGRLEAEFGSPEAIAAAYVNNTDTVEILKGLRIRRRIVAIAAVTAAAILISWASVVTWAAVASSLNKTYYISVSADAKPKGKENVEAFIKEAMGEER